MQPTNHASFIMEMCVCLYYRLSTALKRTRQLQHRHVIEWTLVLCELSNWPPNVITVRRNQSKAKSIRVVLQLRFKQHMINFYFFYLSFNWFFLASSFLYREMWIFFAGSSDCVIVYARLKGDTLWMMTLRDTLSMKKLLLSHVLLLDETTQAWFHVINSSEFSGDYS